MLDISFRISFHLSHLVNYLHIGPSVQKEVHYLQMAPSGSQMKGSEPILLINWSYKYFLHLKQYSNCNLAMFILDFIIQPTIYTIYYTRNKK